MNEKLKEMIYKRKSFRKYSNQKVDSNIINQIKDFFDNARPLHPDINVRIEVVDKANVKCILPWVTPQVIAFFSEEKDGYLENAGFMLQQVDLYIQSLGLGTCWLGMGKLDSSVKSGVDDDLKYVIMLSFGHTKEAFRSGSSDFSRKPLSKITDVEDKKLEPARLAPSSINSQPWYFAHEDNAIHTYCVRNGFLKTKARNEMNLIDVGIALAHMYVEYSETFDFFISVKVKEIKDYIYVGSFIV